MDETEALKARLKRATELLREWRDKHGGREHYAFGVSGAAIPGLSLSTASPTDLLRDTQRFLEGRL